MDTMSHDSTSSTPPAAATVRSPRVVVGVHGSTASLAALRFAVSEARLRDAELWSVIVWRPPGGDQPHPGGPTRELENDIQRHCHRRLQDAWDQALGGVPHDLLVSLAVIRGDSARVLQGIASESRDLLVVGAPSRNPVKWIVERPTARACLRRAACPCVLVPPPALAAELGTGRWRAHQHARRAARLATRQPHPHP